MRVAIVDDEDLARRRLERLLAAHRDVEVVASLGDAVAASAALPGLAPDLVLLDVRMPQRDGFDVAAALAGASAEVVFVTAYDSYAVRAFETGAIDYLLKPVDRERLELALERARTRRRERAEREERTERADRTERAERAERTEPAERAERSERPAAAPLDEVLRALRPDAGDRFAVRDGSRLQFVAVAEVDAVVADGNYVALRAGGRTHSLRATLSSIEERLDPAAFVRLHRSVLVRTARIVAIEPLFRGEYLVTLADGTTHTSARGQRAALRKALGLPP